MSYYFSAALFYTVCSSDLARSEEHTEVGIIVSVQRLGGMEDGNRLQGSWEEAVYH